MNTVTLARNVALIQSHLLETTHKYTPQLSRRFATEMLRPARLVVLRAVVHPGLREGELVLQVHLQLLQAQPPVVPAPSGPRHEAGTLKVSTTVPGRLWVCSGCFIEFPGSVFSAFVIMFRIVS